MKLKRCAIEQVGKQRNGKPRFWCSVHRAGATGPYGSRLAVCEGAYRDIHDREILEIDPADFAGGIALWGAVPAVYDTTSLPLETGIHVHARGNAEGEKEIDKTVDAVMIRHRRDLIEDQNTVITSEVAVNYYISRFAKRDIRFLRCTHCDEMHLDAGYFAVKPHLRHLCHGCGRYFNDVSKGVSNPIASLAAGGLAPGPVPPVRPSRGLDIRQGDYPGGLQIWASNPALIWTAARPEEEGLHVHGFFSAEKLAFDETYSSVTIDGIELNEVHIQYMMAQKALSYLENKIECLLCNVCQAPHFDQGDEAFFPHLQHQCETCDAWFFAPGRRRLLVSNPFVRTRELLLSLDPIARNHQRS